MSEDKPTLLPCPFCGSAAEFGEHSAYSTDSSFDCIRCTNNACGALMYEHHAPSWNRRRALPLQDHGWQDISTAPTGDDDFYLVCCDDLADDRSPFVVRGSIFASARKHPVQHHLSLAYLTHWRPLPAKPAAMVAEEATK